MNLHTLIEFRHEIYSSFRQAKDALFNLVDALASKDRAQSLPELSLSPYFALIVYNSRQRARRVLRLRPGSGARLDAPGVGVTDPSIDLD